MAVTILIPTPLRKFTDEHDSVTVDAASISEMVSAMVQRYPGIGGPMLDERGDLRRFVNVYVNDEDIRFLQGKETPLKDGDSVSIVPAIAGG